MNRRDPRLNAVLALSGLLSFVNMACGDEGPAGLLFKVEAGLITVQTKLIPAETVAGSPVRVQCIAIYEDTREVVLGLDVATISVHPGADVSLEGDIVQTQVAGRYSVACDVRGVTELLPAELVVRPDEAYRVRTEIDRHRAEAGEPVNVTCIVEDQFANPTTARDVLVRTQPSRGVRVDDRVVHTELAGDYSIECSAFGLGREPQFMTVVAGPPTRAAVELSDYGVMAGERVEVRCHLADQFGNEAMGDTNYTVTPLVTNFDDQGFTAQTAGQYWVTCHAPTFSVESDPTLLTVYPNLPVSISILSLTPQALIYARTDIVDVAVLVLDIYGNEVTNADVVFRGDPTGTVVDVGFGQAMLLGDGAIELIAEVVSPTYNNQTVEDRIMLLVDGSPPSIEFLFPTRAEFVVGAPNAPLVVRGRITDAISGVANFSINGDMITPDASGNFQFTMNPEWGVNLIEGNAWDNVGNEKAFAQSYQYSSEYRRISQNRINSGRIYDGLIAHLGQEALDDGQPDVDDLARIAELAIENLDINSLIPSPISTYNSDCSFWPFTIRGALRMYVDNVTFDSPDVQFTAINGGLYARIEIRNLRITLRTRGDVCDIPINLNGTATANTVVVSGDILISGNGNSVQVSMPSPNVSISGLNINLNLPGIISWAVNGIINLFSSQISNLVGNAMEDAIRTAIPDALRGFLESMTVATSFDLPPPVSVRLNLDTNLGMVQFDTVGGNLGLDTSIYAQGTITPEPRGGIIQENQLIPTFSPNHSLAVAIGYDTINQVLYSLWYGGGLDIDAADFLSGSSGQGTGVQANLTGLGPPVLKPISGSGNPVELQIGDMKLDLVLSNIPNSPPINAVVYATLFVDANVIINASGEVELSIGQNVRLAMEFDTDLDAFVDLGLLINTIEVAIQGLLPQIVSQALGSIPIPSFDLSTMAGNYLPPGIVLGLGNATTRFHPSYIILEGSLVQLP